ncbi:hypothetical protein H0A61_01202 [Koleobacter methoxysyntrophicus]|uniref:Transposase n=1 Tax=Koleobacter methoxysyntrophicus TaxID=2751313 RepID=A0A8A0RN29_9FIRM|nr:hypothetical protein [Koleobacter methoxysyntrophicus]QSQ08857.1 hypothetical protein H0A61_01202 [Koleobacter methoxysyntrophicus]
MTKTGLKEQWEKRIKQYKASNTSISAWCRANNIKPSTFRYWLDKEKAVDIMQKEPEAAKWLPVEIDNDKSENTAEEILIVKIGSAAIEVREGFNKKLFQEIIRILAASC